MLSRRLRPRRRTGRSARAARDHGSVTVVLAALLVPVLLIVSVFVDGGRVVLAQPVVTSAQQLALNDVLSQNSSELHQVFGLLGVVKDEGLLDDAAYETLASSLSSDDGGDILQVVLDGDGQGLEPVAGANLGEPSVLANQIVEFMKYRAPLGFAEDLAESLGWLTKLKERIALVKARIKYLDKVSEVLEKATDVLKKVTTLRDALQDVLASMEDVSESVDTLVTLSKAEEPDTKKIAKELKHLGELVDTLDDRLDAAQSAASDLADGDELDDLIAACKDLVSGPEQKAYRDAIDDLQGSSGVGDGSDEGATQDGNTEIAQYTDGVKDLQKVLEDLRDSTLDTVEQTVTGMRQDVSDAIDDLLDRLGQTALESITADDVDEIVDSVEQDLKDAKTALAAAIGKTAQDGLDAIEKDVADAVDKAGAIVSSTVADKVKEKFDAKISDVLGEIKSKLTALNDLYSSFADDKASAHLGESGLGSELPSSGSGGGGGSDASDSVPDGDDIGDADDLADSGEEMLGFSSDLVGALGGALERVRDSVLIAEYVMGEFSYTSLLAEDSSPHNLRAEPFPECATPVSKGGSGTCAAEAEYILTGVNSPRLVLTYVFLIRLALNMVPAFQDPVVRRITMAAAAATSWFPPLAAALRIIIPVGAAIIQSVDDLERLAIKGEAVPLYSPRLSVFDGKTYLDDLADAVENEDTLNGSGGGGGQGGGGQGGGGQGNGGKGGGGQGTGDGGGQGDSFGPELTYRNYLEIFLIVALIPNLDGVVLRTGDIVQCRMGDLVGGDFRLARARTAFTLTTTYQVRPLATAFFDADAGAQLFGGAGVYKKTRTAVAGY